MTSSLQSIATPCINVCTVGADGMCTGCFRTVKEIGFWSQWDNSRRIDLMDHALGERERVSVGLLSSLHPRMHPPVDEPINWTDIGPLFELQGEPEAVDGWREAAVLIPLVARESGIHVLLTKRTESLRQHSGQVSFPGGAQDPDDRDIVVTALREANEEIGIPARQFHVVGYLDRFATISRYFVTPVVAWLDADYVAHANPSEVDAVFEIPLSFLMEDRNYFERSMTINGYVREIGEYKPYAGAPYRVWGATAAMLRTLRDQLLEAPSGA